MTNRGYTVLGWVAFQIIRWWMSRNKAKVGAGATVLAVLIGGLIAARAGSGED